MEINLPEVVKYLLTEGFITAHKGKLELSSKLQKAFVAMEKNLKEDTTNTGLALAEVPNNLPVISSRNLLKIDYGEWCKYYIEFIQEAKVPRSIMNSRNEPYYTNKYSEDGMKAFQKALKEGVDYTMLVRSTILYYKSAGMKKAIGTYMSTGSWRSDYEALVSAAKTGTLSDHIKTEVKGEYNSYSLG